MKTENYTASKFTIMPSRNGYTVYYDGVFFEFADSYREATNDINEAIKEMR